MDKLSVSKICGLAAIALVVVYGICHLNGVGAFLCGVMLIAFAVKVTWRRWGRFGRLPKSFWWYCALATCLGGIGLLLVKSASGQA